MDLAAKGPNWEELANRLTELEQANTTLRSELIILQEERKTTNGQLEMPLQKKSASSLRNTRKPATSRQQRSRRGLLRKGLGIAAAVTVGAGALLETSAGTALANITQGPTTFNNNGGTSPAVTANSTSPSTSKVNAIKATSTGYSGIAGITNSTSSGASGLYGVGPTVGVAGQVQGANTSPTSKVAVYGTGSNGSNLGAIGVMGQSDTNTGVNGTSSSGNGVSGTSSSGHGVSGTSSSGSNGYGVYGQNSNGYGVVGSGARGVFGLSVSGNGVTGISNTDVGVWGQSYSGTGTGVLGSSPGASTLSSGNIGVYGTGSNGSNNSGIGVFGEGDTNYGVVGYCPAYNGWGVGAYGDSSIGVGLYASGATGILAYGFPAGNFEGDVYISGNLTKGGGSFKIDHPLDPANKYLYHSFVESPDMKNVYDGVVTLDANGEATVTLPSWFETLNSDFRYQLTAIGVAGPNLHVATELSNLSFKIAGGTAGMKVCWQVTGIRQDAWAQANRIPVEKDKSASERGHYLYPKLYGHSTDPSIGELPYAEKVSRFKKLHR